MFAIEATVIANASAGRRREFASVRYCARQALRRVGAPPEPILPDADGVPQWPAGVIGSMTHCAGYRAAVVARTDGLLGIGIDAEPHAPLPDLARDIILRDEEWSRLRALAADRSDLHWDRIVFCAKEAVYKASFPLTRRWLDFTDIAVSPDVDGTFQARVSSVCADPTTFVGRWTADRGIVVAGTSMTP
jgi:4'-phosphopantetheinyl transferase EntD